MATADQISRTESARCDYQMRFYVSGKYALANLDSIAAGASYDPTASAELDAAMDRDSTQVVVDDTTGFPDAGTIIIGPGDDGESNEVVGYTSKTGTTFDGLTRGEFEVSDGLAGVHTAGATVSQWEEITAKVLRLSLRIDDRDGIVAWSATVQGIGFDSSLLDRDRALLCMARWRPSSGDIATWTAWEVWFLGYIQEINPADDHTRLYTWSAIVEGLHQFVATTDIPAHNFGKTDLAAGKAVSVSSYLTDPYLLAGAGEFIGGPELNGDQLVDDDLGTLWVSEGEPTSTPDTLQDSGMVINECYLQAETGQPDVQWVEIHNALPGDDPVADTLRHYYLVAKCTTWRAIDWTDKSIPLNNYVDFSNLHVPMDSKAGSFAIVTNNAVKFLERWGSFGADHVIDWRGQMVGDFEIDPAGDFLALHWFGSTQTDIVWFGTITPHNYGKTGTTLFGYDWTGAAITVPAAGHSFRRDPTGTKSTPGTTADWEMDEDHPTPGNYLTGDPEWATVDLGVMGIELDVELSAVETAEAALTATLGLTGSGDVMIDTEVIGYETRDDDDHKLLTLTRAKYGTSAAVHPAGSTVYQYEDSAATACHQISGISWRRKRVLDANGAPIVPRNFDVFISTSADPITPDSVDWNAGAGLGGWPDYWTRLVAVQGNTETYWQTTFDALRARHVLICVYDMSDGGRAKLNQLHVYATTLDIATGLAGTATDDGSWSGDVIKYLLVNHFYLDASLFTMTEHGRPFESLPTTEQRGLDIIRDICRRTGCCLAFHLDHSVEHRYDPRYPLGVIPDIDIDWDRDNARSVQLTQPPMHNVSQVVLRASDPFAESLFEVRYPPTALELGSELALDDMLLGGPDDARLMAMMRFAEANGLRQASVVPVGLAEWVRPGQRHTLTWTLDEEGTYLQARNFVVEAVSFDIDFGSPYRDKAWRANIQLRELVF